MSKLKVARASAADLARRHQEAETRASVARHEARRVLMSRVREFGDQVRGLAGALESTGPCRAELQEALVAHFVAGLEGKGGPRP